MPIDKNSWEILAESFDHALEKLKSGQVDYVRQYLEGMSENCKEQAKVAREQEATRPAIIASLSKISLDMEQNKS